MGMLSILFFIFIDDIIGNLQLHICTDALQLLLAALYLKKN
jgi:hypothetical protein